MTGLAALAAVVIVTGWIGERLADLVLPASAPRHWAPAAAYGGAAVAAVLGGYGFGIWVSALTPVGAMVPVLCLAWSLKRLGWLRMPDVPPADLALLALLGAAVLAGAAGFLPLSPYAWFYTGPGPALLTGALALWALWRGQTAVLIGLCAAHAAWLADIGSSNLYDQVSHALLVPWLAALAAARAVLPERGEPEPGGQD